MDTVESLLRGMYSDVKNSRELLTEITTKENYENIFSPGERESIEQLGKSVKFKSEILCSAVSALEVLPNNYQTSTK